MYSAPQKNKYVLSPKRKEYIDKCLFELKYR